MAGSPLHPDAPPRKKNGADLLGAVPANWFFSYT
jgi:hypothetical protein